MHKAVFWVFLITGCLIIFANPIQFTFGVSLLPLWFLKLTTNSLLIRTAAFVAIIGIAGIVRKHNAVPS